MGRGTVAGKGHEEGVGRFLVLVLGNDYTIVLTLGKP